MTIPVTGRITATPSARTAISHLRAARGAPVMFVQSGGCPEGFSLPAGDGLRFVTAPLHSTDRSTS